MWVALRWREKVGKQRELHQLFSCCQPGSSPSFPALKRFQNSRTSCEPEPWALEKVSLILAIVTGDTETQLQQRRTTKDSLFHFPPLLLFLVLIFTGQGLISQTKRPGCFTLYSVGTICLAQTAKKCQIIDQKKEQETLPRWLWFIPGGSSVKVFGEGSDGVVAILFSRSSHCPLYSLQDSSFRRWLEPLSRSGVMSPLVKMLFSQVWWLDFDPGTHVKSWIQWGARVIPALRVGD